MIGGGDLEEMNRQQVIHDKGFDMTNYNKIKVGIKNLDDAILNLGYLQQTPCKGAVSKGAVMQALALNDVYSLREISAYYYKVSGIYQKVCNYFATMYRYDWYVVSEVYTEEFGKNKVEKDLMKVLKYLDNSYIKKTCGDIALGVIKNGAYYGYIVPTGSGIVIQELPVDYCRSRYTVNNLPAVEFNMKFFDQAFPDVKYRMEVLNLFPKEFKQGYTAWKNGRLPQDPAVGINRTEKPRYSGSYLDRDSGWYLLDPNQTVKFSFNNGGNGAADIPLFVNAIPAILDLDAAQDLDRKKQMQKLLKIIIQKLPLDKNGDLIFDVDEAQDIHNNAVRMLKRAVGVDVLTTFADIEAIDMSDSNTATSTDDLEKVERAVYNAIGTSQNLFNTDGNLSLEKSILNDEGSVRTLLLQFGIFYDRLVQQMSSNRKKYSFRFYMLETTQYNYKELSKMYKEQTQIGFSKMLPQIALGHSQSSILNTIYFENEILNLPELMIPPLMSSTLNMEDLQARKSQSGSSNSQGTTDSESVGRPEKSDSEKSEKTIANRESMS